jgi:gliding motility-associated-like protein
MKYIFILILLVFNLNSQTVTVELCNNSPVTFWVELPQYYNVEWNISPILEPVNKYDEYIVFNFYNEGTYILSASLLGPCITDNTKVKINVVYCLDSFVYIPNTFTPNGDGINDTWKPSVLGIRDYELWVFNRWGEQLFYSRDSTEYWIPKINNVTLQNDVYTYKFKYKNHENTYNLKFGKITLVR